MTDKVDAWQMEITSLTWEFQKTTNNLGLGSLNYKAQATSWSVAEILSHLIRLNSSYYPIFDQLIGGNYKPPLLAKIPFLAKSLGKMIYRSMESPSKVKTFALWEPESVNYGLDLLGDFNNHQMELSAYIQELEPFFDKGKIIHSPANKLLAYELDQAIDILISHEKRHLQQCKNVISIKANFSDK